jgi:hypothetical protein
MDGARLFKDLRDHLRPWYASPVNEETSLKVLLKCYDQTRHDAIASVFTKIIGSNPFMPPVLCDDVTSVLSNMVVRSEPPRIVFSARNAIHKEQMESLGFDESLAYIECDAKVESGRITQGCMKFDAYDIVTFRAGSSCPRFVMLALERLFEEMYTVMFPREPAMIVERCGYPCKADALYAFLPHWRINIPRMRDNAPS